MSSVSRRVQSSYLAVVVAVGWVDFPAVIARAIGSSEGLFGIDAAWNNGLGLREAPMSAVLEQAVADEADTVPVSAAESPASERKLDRREKTKKQPRYHVILLDDDEHTYAYVIEMLGKLFHHPRTRAFKMAREVDRTGRVICLTTTMELAELKRDQVLTYGPDPWLDTSPGSMRATIEPADE